jgi:hypothetical protein
VSDLDRDWNQLARNREQRLARAGAALGARREGQRVAPADAGALLVAAGRALAVHLDGLRRGVRAVLHLRGLRGLRGGAGGGGSAEGQDHPHGQRHSGVAGELAGRRNGRHRMVRR